MTTDADGYEIPTEAAVKVRDMLRVAFWNEPESDAWDLDGGWMFEFMLSEDSKLVIAVDDKGTIFARMFHKHRLQGNAAIGNPLEGSED